MSSKAIEVNSSSLVGLKVELARAQERFRQQLANPEAVAAARRGMTGSTGAKSKKFVMVPPGAARRVQAATQPANKGVAEREARDKEATASEGKTLEQSARSLEAKARIYDELQRTGGTGAAAGKLAGGAQELLVDFERKIFDAHDEAALVRAQPLKRAPRADDSSDSEDDATRARRVHASRPQDVGWAAGGNSSISFASAPAAAELPGRGGELVSYTDVFGRERTVPRVQVAELRRMDAEVRGDDPLRPSLLSDDMRRALAQQEADRLARQANGEEEQEEAEHFQASMLSDRRAFGTGYYAFSVDEQERSEQMAKLNQLRTDTVLQRNKREDLKRKRTALQDQRLAKIKQRRTGIVEDADDGFNNKAAVPFADGGVGDDDDIADTSAGGAADAAAGDDDLADLLAFYRAGNDLGDELAVGV